MTSTILRETFCICYRCQFNFLSLEPRLLCSNFHSESSCYSLGCFSELFPSWAQTFVEYLEHESAMFLPIPCRPGSSRLMAQLRMKPSRGLVAISCTQRWLICRECIKASHCAAHAITCTAQAIVTTRMPCVRHISPRPTCARHLHIRAWLTLRLVQRTSGIVQ